LAAKNHRTGLYKALARKSSLILQQDDTLEHLSSLFGIDSDQALVKIDMFDFDIFDFDSTGICVTKAKREFNGWGRMMSIVFISYRRNDSAGYAGRLADRLAKEWGEEWVFRDYDDISPGQDFFMTINDNLNSAHVMLVMIGKEWLTCPDESGRRRIDDPQDFVRLEIETALQRNIQIIPVLVKGARMPAPSDLPESISELAFRQAIELTDSRWAADVEKLIESVNPHIDQGLVKQKQADGKSLKRRKIAGIISLGLVVSGIIWALWLPADFSGHWYFDGGNYLRIVQQGNKVNIEHIDPAMQKVYETGEGRIKGRWLEFTLNPIYTDRFSYSGRLNKSWDNQELQGELIEILSNEKSALKLSHTDPQNLTSNNTPKQ
jgi:hypothetical protein